MTMQLFRNLSIRRKQMLIIMLTSGVVLLLASAAFIVYDTIAFRGELVAKTSTLAEIIGNNCTASLDFNDPETAEQTLAALRGEPNIVAACAYEREGRPFALYRRDGGRAAAIPPGALAAGHEFTRDQLRLFRTIQQGGETVGTIFIVSDLRELSDRLARYATIVGLVLGVSMVVAFTLSSGLQRLISAPLLHLAQVAQAVAQEKNYSLRATKHGDDELGRLIDGFNEMLVQIQARDLELGNARDQLERRVEARTKELAQSVSLLNATLEAGVEGILAMDLQGRATCFNQKFLALWQIPADVIQRREIKEMAAHAASRVKNPEAFHARVREMLAFPETEAFDVLEFNDGRLIEQTMRPQFVGERCVGNVISFRDITERRRSEEALRHTEELYRQAISGADAVPYSYRYETKSYAFMGEGIGRLIGYAPEEMTPGLWQHIIQESVMLGETAGLAKAEAARRVAAGELLQWRCDMQVLTREGRSRWISDSSIQELDATGKPVGSMGILQDITERKQAEIVAMAFSRLGRNLSCAASREDAARIICEIADDLFGWDACSLQVYSSSDDTVFSIFEVDTFEGKRVPSKGRVRRKPTELHQRIFKSGAELILRDASSFLPGSTAFGNHSRPSASIMYAPIRTTGEIVGLLSIHSYTQNAYTEQQLGTLQTLADHCGGALERIRADEARRESESQFRLVWETSADGMRLADREGKVLLVNHAYCRMVEKAKEEVEGHSVGAIHCSEEAERVTRGHRDRIDSGCAQWHLESEVTLWNGRKVWFELSNSLLNLPGQPVMLLSIFRDITQRKQAESELEAMHRELLGVSRQAGMAEVATSVLHNVGNVLNSVNTSASVVVDRLRKSQVTGVARVGELLEANRHDLAGFLTTNGRADQVINFLKSLSQHLETERSSTLAELHELAKNIEHIKEIVVMQQSYAKVSGVTERVKVTDLVEDALRMNSGALARHHVRLVRDFAPQLPEIMVEKHKVLQILVNLIRNAKYACDEANQPDSCLTIRIAQANDRVRITVADNGVGIPAENLTRIFSHGFTTRKQGHGFGLHSGALAARELGGLLTVHSDGPGKGAEFTLELPCNCLEIAAFQTANGDATTKETLARA